MKAGRELDKLVGERVFGYEVVTHNSIGRPDYYYKSDGALILLPQYSKHIASAWLVVEKLKRSGFVISIDWGNVPATSPVGGEPVRAYFRNSTVYGQAAALTVPHAICLAAVATVKA